MLFVRMFDEIPCQDPDDKDPAGNRNVRDYHHLLQVLNYTLTHAPIWTVTMKKTDTVACPMSAILDLVQETPSGEAVFLNPDVSRMFKKILNEWGKFLQTPESAEVLNAHKHGWFGPGAEKDMMDTANAPYKTAYKFEEFYHCDPAQRHYGFKSWDDFFTRRFREEVRPIASPRDDNVIASACESEVYNVERNAKLRDKFWIKEQPYSVQDMLAMDELADQFAGSTVFQAFLSAVSYHRWHAPVSGKVVKAYVQDGTYFSQPIFEGITDSDVTTMNPEGSIVGQPYLAALATRAIVFIQADNPAIGLMAFVGVGMNEVSTCELTVKKGQHVKKGQQTGMFHFGGSSHVLLFRKGVKVEGFPETGTNVPVRGQVAIVKP